MELKTKSESTINGRGVWHYEIVTPIGTIHAVEYVTADMSVKRYLYDEDGAAAARKYAGIVKGMASGKI